jgi:hypothetical protein
MMEAIAMLNARKIPVTERALLQRINRKLKPDYERIVKARGRAISQCGEYYKLDFYSNMLREYNVSLEDTGRELKVLAPWEKLVTEG